VTFTPGQIDRLEQVSHIPPTFPQSILAGNAMDMMFGNVKVETRN
jgi:hypothetical protein